MRFNNFWTYRRLLFSARFLAALRRSRANLFCADAGAPLPAGPYMAELDVTYRCDCACRMCRRWEARRGEELTRGDYAALARTFRRMGVHLVSIAGGEPFLREDIFPILASFAGAGMAVNVSTNGLLLEKYGERILGSGAACITVSVDGATAETHEKVRGTPGSYAIIERGLQTILAAPAGKRPLLRVRMTVCRENLEEVGRFYEKWQGVADDILLQPVHRCPDSFYIGPDEDLFRLDPEILARQLAGTPFEKKGGYLHAFLQSRRRGELFPPNRCYAGVLMVRVDPWGNVYPCLEQHVRVGSVKEDDFESIWASEAFASVRKNLAGSRECGCWYNNTALLGHYAGILRRWSL